MLHYTEWNINKHPVVTKKNRKLLKNNQRIFTLDIETTSYLYKDNKSFLFDYEKDGDFYKEYAKQAYCYIWMLSIDEVVFYGRYLEELKEFINKLNEELKGTKGIIYVHNLSFEFQFLINILNFENVFTRERHKVISCDYRDFTFKCSYSLSNLSLDKLAKEEGLIINKKVGQLDYNVIRNSLTPLTDEELEYCESDCLIVYEYIKKMCIQYGKIEKIPLTHTGKVRKMLKEYIIECGNNPRFAMKDWKIKIAKLTPDRETFEDLCRAFAGGYTHANAFFTGRLLNNVFSYDISSSYPAVLVNEKYPSTKFTDETEQGIERIDRELCSYIFKVKFNNIESINSNNFISVSKCELVDNPVIDNGRLDAADEIIITVTDVDLDTIKENYIYDRIEYLKIYSSFKKYLPKPFLQLVLDLYKEKTEIKGIDNLKEKYRLLKSHINSLYGMAVTKTIKNEVTFENGEWKVQELTEDRVSERLEEQQEELENILPFQWGVFCSAYARRNLWKIINKIDEDVVYCDTDSVKFINLEKNICYIEEYNNNLINLIKKSSMYNKIDISYYMPVDSTGVERPIGSFESDGIYEEFKTLGAKKYCYRENGKLNITISGVSKKTGIKALKDDINNFEVGLLFDYETSGKKSLYYNDEQEEVELTDNFGNTQTVNDKKGVCLLPTTYLLGITEEYKNFIDNCYLEFL